MDLSRLNGIFLIGTLTDKKEEDYTDKDGKPKKSYRLKFDYMGGSYSINTDEVTYTKVELGMIYAIEIKPYTNEKMKSVIYLNDKSKKLFELNDNGFNDLI